jgi:GT2 family glycosyltransferase
VVNNASLVDIVIVNFNSTDFLLRCLRSVYEALEEIPARIIIEDNDSGDGVGRIQAMFPQVKLSKGTHNVGFSKAANKGLKEGNSPYVVLLNPDTYVPPGFFGTALRYMEENPDIGIMGPKVLNLDGSVQGSARSFPTPLTALFGRNTLLTKWFPRNRTSLQNVITTKSDGISPMEVDWVSGACMIVRRRAIQDVGLMDERFFMYWEDADWCRRMRESGWKVVYLPQASIVHFVGGSSEKLLVRSVFEFHKSSYCLFRKHSNSHFHYLMPLVLSALGLRAVLVLATQEIRRMSGRLKDSMTSGKFSSSNGGRIPPNNQLRTLKSPRNEFQDRNYLHCR